jgi:hypothetical protein
VAKVEGEREGEVMIIRSGFSHKPRYIGGSKDLIAGRAEHPFHQVF